MPSSPSPSDVPSHDDAPAAAPLARTHAIGSYTRSRRLTPTLPDVGEPGHVRLVDAPSNHVRRPQDALGIILALVGIALVLLLTVFAHATTVGVQQDVRGFSRLLAQILTLPVVLLEGVVTLGVPLVVLGELAWRRHGRQVIESLTAAGLGLLLALVAYWGVTTFGAQSLVAGLTISVNEQPTLSLPAYVAAISGLLVGAGPRTRRRSVAWSWNVLWFTLGIYLVTGQVSLAGVFLMLLVGRVAGLVVRYASGVRSERAHGATLVDGVRRAGFEPTALVRVRDLSDRPHDVVQDIVPDGDASVRRSGPWWSGSALGTPEPSPFDEATLALMRSSDHRVYSMTTAERDRLDVVVLDGERQVVGMLARAWRSLRMRGIEGRSAISLRQIAERSALLQYSAQAAGVRTPELLGVAAADDSMILVQEHISGSLPLRDIPELVLDDMTLAECWRQLLRAHDAGLAHRSLTADVVLVGHDADGQPQVWLTGWENGDIASAELARRVDLTQMLALLALRVGPERALASVSGLVPAAEVEALGPLLQTIALPRGTRDEIRRSKSDVLDRLRDEIVARLPEANVEPLRLVRFGVRTVLTAVLAIVAVSVLVTKFKFDQIAQAVADANPWWAVTAFAVGCLTWFGAALALMAFSPARLSLWKTTLTQVAASYVSIAAPAGIGPAALNLRLLTRAGTSGTLAAASVALVQVAQVIVTIVILVILAAATGDGGLLRQLPSAAVLVGLGVLAALIAGVLLVPAVRRWAGARIEPILNQTWPRLSTILSSPRRIAIGLAGNALMSLGYIFAFAASLKAFGLDVALVDASVIYLLGNTAGAAVPVPGGIGAVEGALTLGLQLTAGVLPAVGATAVMLFRVMTFWLRIPIGAVAMRVLQRSGDL
ncbi:lysylphosphatidylglycerol synthase domain-containing protein [Sanguibacter sp. A247]|uniref:lysylphosphatidylglycerol synthase domain-containing protein n=1 Tax=unclassified Sanguibacter TaxID=2645534 RepID=UPI003FD6F557